MGIAWSLARTAPLLFLLFWDASPLNTHPLSCSFPLCLGCPPLCSKSQLCSCSEIQFTFFWKPSWLSPSPLSFSSTGVCALMLHVFSLQPQQQWHTILKLCLPCQRTDQRWRSKSQTSPFLSPASPLFFQVTMANSLAWSEEPLPGTYTPALAHTLTTLLNRCDPSTPILQLDFFLIVPRQHS